MLLFVRSDAHAMEEVTSLFYNSLGRARVNNSFSKKGVENYSLHAFMRTLWKK